MKKWMIEFFFLILIFLVPVASAEQLSFECMGLADGWLSGMITTSIDSRICEIKLDCAVPEEPYPYEVVMTGDRYFSKKDMQRALKAAGQSLQGQFLNNRTSTLYTGDWRADAAADLSCEESKKQAIRIGLSYYEALGVEVDPQPVSVDRPYDYDAQLNINDMYFSHVYADQESANAAVERFSVQWKKISRYHPKQTAYTRVEFAVIVDGMRFYTLPQWLAGFEDEPDAWIGYDVSAYVIVSDSGILVEAGTNHIPEIKKRRAPKEGELENYAHLLHTKGSQNLVCAPSWQEALSIAVTNSRNGANIISLGEEAGEQTVYRDGQSVLTRVNAKQGVITAIKPCMNTISENTWIMSWKFYSTNDYEDGWRE